MTNITAADTPENNEEVTPAIALLRGLVDDKPGGEHRPQQERMATLVEEAITKGEHLLVQAGTGTGKTLGYAVAAVAAGKRTVISTATKQLSEQIIDKDLPVLSKAVAKKTGQGLSFALLKGRDNYLCLKKLNENTTMADPNEQPDLSALLPDDEKSKPMFSVSKGSAKKELVQEFSEMYDWADRTRTGDRSEAPAVSDKTWQGFSTSNSDCPGKTICPFGAECFAERARNRARESQIVVTNHAVVGADRNEGILLGEREVLIADEMHELDSYLSSAWGTEFTPKKLLDVATAIRKSYRGAANASAEKDIAKLAVIIDALMEYFIVEEPASYDEGLPGDLYMALTEARNIIAKFVVTSDTDNPNPAVKVAINKSKEMLESMDMLLTTSAEVVRWSERPWTRPGAPPANLLVKAAPLRIGPKLMQTLEDASMTFIGTSATITVAGAFEIPARNLALSEPIGPALVTPRPYMTADTGTPFDYSKQGILYIPDPNLFPEPIGKDRLEHGEAVKTESLRMLEASQGRGLVLSATTKGSLEIGEFLRKNLDVKVLIQGDAPAPVLVEEFKRDINSVLVATRGMWHGLDAPGETLILDIMDKIPFPRMDDPLMKARQKDIESRGGNGFMDAYVADANTMLAQGAGRLIRHTSDRGIVAILDTRLTTKRYGGLMLRSIPPMYRTNSIDVVLKSLSNL